MEIIRRKILREELLTRESGPRYGVVNSNVIYFNIFLTQDLKNMGVFSEQPFIEATTNHMDINSIYDDYRPNFEKKAWFKVGTKITADTDSKLIDLKGYKEQDRYKKGFDSKKETYVNFRNFEIQGVSRITEKTPEKTTYVFDAPNNGFIGTPNQTEGLLYNDIVDQGTDVTFIPQGVNNTNSSIMALTKEEYLMGIINKPRIQNDVFIDRGEVAAVEPHLRLGEVDTLEHLINYGNGYYNVVK